MKGQCCRRAQEEACWPLAHLPDDEGRPHVDVEHLVEVLGAGLQERLQNGDACNEKPNGALAGRWLAGSEHLRC